MLGRCRTLALHGAALKVAMLQHKFDPCRYVGGLSKKVRPLTLQNLALACSMPQLISMASCRFMRSTS